jgi:hypothetical protein
MPGRAKDDAAASDGAIFRAVVAHALGAPGSSGEIAVNASGARAELASAASGSLVIGDVELAGSAHGVVSAEALKVITRAEGDVELSLSRRVLRVKAGRTSAEAQVTPGPSDYSWMWPTDTPALTAFFLRSDLETALDAVSDWDDVELVYAGPGEGFELRSGSRSRRIDPVRRPRRRRPLAIPVHLPTLRLLLAGHTDQVAVDVWELRGVAVTSDARLRGLLLAGQPQPQRRSAVDLRAEPRPAPSRDVETASQVEVDAEPQTDPEPPPRRAAGDARVKAARRSAARYLERAASQLRGAQERLDEVGDRTAREPIDAALRSLERALADLGNG